MSKTVGEIMNRELFRLRDGDVVDGALRYFAALGIAGAPVVDDDDALVGFVSWRDLVGAPARGAIATRMTAPVDRIGEEMSIAEAARRMCQTDRHHLVVVDEDHRPIGFVGSLDLLRAVLGEPGRHPSAFPHLDPGTGLSWTDEARLEPERIGEAPEGPGMFLLIRPRSDAPNEVVWSEATNDVRARLAAYFEAPKRAPAHLAAAIAERRLWFRVCVAPSSRALPAADD